MIFPEDPSPGEYRRALAAIDADMALARRLLSAFESESHDAICALLTEVESSGRGASVLMALGVQCLDALRALAINGLLTDEHDRPATVQRWLDTSAMLQLDVVADDQRRLRDSDDD